MIFKRFSLFPSEPTSNMATSRNSSFFSEFRNHLKMKKKLLSENTQSFEALCKIARMIYEWFSKKAPSFISIKIHMYFQTDWNDR